MSNSAPMRSFKCPTSGQMLGELVSAFRLHLPSVGGPTSEFLGSGNSGKRARDYFQGDWVPEATRHDICKWIVRALMHSGMLPEVRLPVEPSGEAPEVEQTVRMALFTWLQVWDGLYVVASEPWPSADPALSAFVIGRQAVIDMALRWSALCYFSGLTDPAAIVLEDGRSGKAKSILASAAQRAGKSMTREDLARALRVLRRGRTNDRTVDRWYDGLVIPDDTNLAAIAEALSSADCPAPALLRFLRLQYAGLSLAMRARAAVGPRLGATLIDGLLKFVRCSLGFHQVMRGSTESDPEQRFSLDLAAFKLLMMGSGDPAMMGWINAWLSVEQGPLWHDDLQYAGNGAADARVVACLKVVGDWPRMEAAFARHAATHPGMHVSRELIEVAVIMTMNDNRVTPEMEAWIAAHPEQVRRIVGDDQMKAANRAEAGTAAMNQRDYDAAIPQWARAVELETDPRRKSNYLFQYGSCLWQARAHRFDDAIQALTESFRLWPLEEPKRDRPFVEIAIIYQNRGCFEQALYHLDGDPCGLAETSGHFNFVKARSLHVLRRYDEALACFERALELNTDSRPDALDLASDCAFRLNAEKPDRGMRQKAQRYAKEALHLGRPGSHDRWEVG